MGSNYFPGDIWPSFVPDELAAYRQKNQYQDLLTEHAGLLDEVTQLRQLLADQRAKSWGKHDDEDYAAFPGRPELLVLYLRLRKYQGANENTWVGNTALMRDLGISRSALKRDLKALKELGAISRVDRDNETSLTTVHPIGTWADPKLRKAKEKGWWAVSSMVIATWLELWDRDSNHLPKPVFTEKERRQMAKLCQLYGPESLDIAICGYFDSWDHETWANAEYPTWSFFYRNTDLAPKWISQRQAFEAEAPTP